MTQPLPLRCGSSPDGRHTFDRFYYCTACGMSKQCARDGHGTRYGYVLDADGNPAPMGSGGSIEAGSVEPA